MPGKPTMRDGKEFNGAYGGYKKPNAASKIPLSDKFRVLNQAAQEAKKENM